MEVPENVKRRFRAGQGYETDFRPTVESHVSETVRPMIPESETFLLSLDWKGTGKESESSQMPMRQDGGVGGVRKFMGEDTIDYARIKVMSRQGDQISNVDSSNLKPYIEPLISRLDGTLGSDA